MCNSLILLFIIIFNIFLLKIFFFNDDIAIVRSSLQTAMKGFYMFIRLFKNYLAEKRKLQEQEKQMRQKHVDLFKSFKCCDVVKITSDGFYQGMKGSLVEISKYPAQRIRYNNHRPCEYFQRGMFVVKLDNDVGKIVCYPEELEKITKE